jgi:signal peptidase I
MLSPEVHLVWSRNTAENNAQKPEKKHETPMEFLSSTSAVLVVGLFIITFIIQAFEIPSASMFKTLLVGDHLFVDRLTFSPKTPWAPFIPYRHPKDGDIFVFYSLTDPGMHLVKRVIGVAGDRIHLKDGIVYRNGQKLDQPYVVRNGSSDPYRDNFPSVSPELSSVGLTPEWQLTLSSHIEDGELVVPAGYYFAMGDNRDNSYDSRYWGLVPQENIVGRPLFIYWSFITSDTQYTRTSFAERVDFITHVVLHIFDQTRWSRTLRMVR